MMRLVLGAVVVSLATAGCGQKGALYLPPKNGTVITRPAGTTQDSGATTTAAPAGAAGQQQPQDKDKKDEGQPGEPAQQPR
jgi:predicted small lipoprotein YifL